MSAVTQRSDIVIIGTGIAGITTAKEVRKIDADCTITLITAGDGTVYSKPMLSNALALGKSPEGLAQKSAEAFAKETGCTMQTETRVVSIDRTNKRLVLDGPNGRDVVGYGRLVLATGAAPRAYAVEGSPAAPLFTVNDLDDYGQWRRALKPDARVLIIGAGLIGSEFANDLAGAGHVVNVVDPAPWPLGRLLPERLGRTMAEALTRTGVNLFMGRAVTAMFPSERGGWAARLDNGKVINFDIALSAIGLVPNTQLARDAGLAVEQGVRVDARMRTSDADIFAIGDSAQSDAGVLPYILPVMTQARALAKTLTGTPTAAHLPALPVAVKTPALPAVVCPPKPGAEGEWHIEGEGDDLKALFVSPEGRALGFALTGAETKGRQALAKDMPDLLAA